jgi:outer membrane receptor protein involved in Fe transport
MRAGAILFPDDEIGGTFGAVYGGALGEGRFLLGASVQDRRNPKNKYSQRFDEPGGTLDNTEVQTDVRDGRDYSVNAAWEAPVVGGRLDLSGVFVRTDRIQDEDSIEYDGGVETEANLLTINDNDVDIRTDNLALRARYARDMFGGETRLKLGYASFDDAQTEFENEAEYLRDGLPFPEEDRFTAEFEIRDLMDEEISGAVEHTRALGEALELEFGVQAVSKEREAVTDIADRVRFNIPNAPAPRPAQPPFVFTTTRYAIEETRIDPYVMLSGDMGALKWEAGLRYEATDATIAGIETDYAELLPSASLRYRLSDTDRLTLSVARTVRRPDFDDLAPTTLQEERGDNDFRGNPFLRPELAWGVDAGFERRLGRRGVVGFNVFYRDITDLIEDVNTGIEGSGGPGTFIESIDNVGDGEVYGVEFDLSTPLDFIGMETTGVFLNASWLDSKVEDVLGERRFNDQSDYVVNFGFTHDIPTWGAAIGASWRKQGDAFGRVWAREVRTSYGADLEIFVEKRLFANTVVRLAGSNLLDSSKDEVFDKFDDQDDQIARDYDEYELETESAGPVWQLVMRVAF